MQSRPDLIVFDVNETLSDMSPMGERFDAVGAPEHLARTWFAALLRDGFALTAAGSNPSFAEVGRDVLGSMLAPHVDDVATAVEHVMAGFGQLGVHPDVVEGVRALGELGAPLVTLSNGSTSVARGLFERHGLSDAFDRLLSVEDAPRWKPAPEAYAYALDVCGVAPADALLVAVHPWDVHGAHQAGLATAWLDRNGTAYPAHFAAADRQVGSLVELASVLAGATA
ncbi:haloacid dehalogenase, type II [Ornithinimicrobium sp. CNJ-824]|uniref:haloacid dehalogenase type II n=1 Tax=Ornithinimicrobium sp. CNJ-824 TaxID=1904966 RepID=UPI0009688313|nr:haloacid dehalogenase type II [Ornithinimicrobium sp. CNJ-824]OLT20527.1 haloacid dehalogenase, type II [Ornithinimicrobium sp. CNJ-824]